MKESGHSDRSAKRERDSRDTIRKFYSGRPSHDAYYDRPIPKPTTDLGFRGVSHKRTYDSLTGRDHRRYQSRSKSVQGY